MKSLVKKKVGIKSILIAAVILAGAALLASRLPAAKAANTFPHVYDLVSVNNVDGKGINSGGSVRGISNDGRKVLFSSSATSLPDAPSGTDRYAGYVRDMEVGTTKRVDLSQNGTLPDKKTVNHVMSSTGRFIAFQSSASNIIDNSVLSDLTRVYFKDLQTNAVELIVDIPNSVVAGYNTFTVPMSISDDGRFLTVKTNRINGLLPGTRSGNGGGYDDLAMYDRIKQEWTLINKSVDGIMQNQSVDYSVKTSCDGSIIAFSSTATNLASGHSGSGKHIYLADTRNGVHITDMTPGAVGDNIVSSISCNGRYVAYATKDRTLISPTPSSMNAYLHLARYDRYTGERRYVDCKEDGTNCSGYYSNYQIDLPSSVSDRGDVLLMVGPDDSPYSRKVYLKHLSDGSGDFEPAQHDYAGLYYIPSMSPSFMMSADGSHIAAASNGAVALGLLPPPVSPNNYEIIRIKTGL